jgi:hypothetical protein
MPYWLEYGSKLAGILTPVILGGATYYFSRKKLTFDKEGIRFQRDTDLIKWSNDAIQTCAYIQELCTSGEKLERQKLIEESFENLAKLSALIDQGRLYLPNHSQKHYGLDKEPAYQGYRHPALDYLVFFYDGARSQLVNGNSKMSLKQLTSMRRWFISAVQIEVDPRRRHLFVEQQTDMKISEAMAKIREN